jgi:hypothetical protein
MKMAIVKKVKGTWMVTEIGLSDEEGKDLRDQLKRSDEEPDYVVEVPFRVTYHQNED